MIGFATCKPYVSLFHIPCLLPTWLRIVMRWPIFRAEGRRLGDKGSSRCKIQRCPKSDLTLQLRRRQTVLYGTKLISQLGVLVNNGELPFNTVVVANSRLEIPEIFKFLVTRSILGDVFRVREKAGVSGDSRLSKN